MVYVSLTDGEILIKFSTLTGFTSSWIYSLLSCVSCMSLIEEFVVLFYTCVHVYVCAGICTYVHMYIEIRY